MSRRDNFPLRGEGDDAANPGLGHVACGTRMPHGTAPGWRRAGGPGAGDPLPLMAAVVVPAGGETEHQGSLALQPGTVCVPAGGHGAHRRRSHTGVGELGRRHAGHSDCLLSRTRLREAEARQAPRGVGAGV